jgi:lipopolysaccharide/colanic/teichoic acid biosynthesis glycosyltransferase
MAIVRERPTAGPAPDAARRRPLHVMSDEMFRGVLVRERKRADRSNDAFLLVVLEMPNDNRPSWRHAIEALAAVKRDTDMVGWITRDRVLGLMMPCSGLAAGSELRGIEESVRGELAKRLDGVKLHRVSLGVHAHPAPPATDSSAQAVDPLLDALHSRQAPTLAAVAKRGLDIIGSLVLLLFVAPVLMIVAALVKLTSPGPVFFRQVRVGEHAKPFTMLKFRTMRVDADDRLHRQYVAGLIAAGAQGDAASGGVFKITNDPRVTPIGRLLRKTSLDELPQFVNVLLGSMSLVGPRPPIPYEVEQYKPWHTRRVLDAKPGITGLWQVTGRSRTTFDEMVRLDLRYARSVSIWTDIKILLATPRAVLSGKGAC